MALEIECNICGKQINAPGGLWYSGPLVKIKEGFLVLKTHYCVDCEAAGAAPPSLSRGEVEKILREALAKLKETD